MADAVTSHGLESLPFVLIPLDCLPGNTPEIKIIQDAPLDRLAAHPAPCEIGRHYRELESLGRRLRL
jgi:hypothetical protein